MPRFSIRTLRYLTSLLMLLLGASHVGQLWLQPLDSPVVFTAAFGFVYLLIGLGLAGRSRLSLWLGIALTALGSYAGYLRYHLIGPTPFTLVHMAGALLILVLCATVLYRGRGVIVD